jgi:hypothetical protein
MTVSIPKPYWRLVNGVRERAAGMLSRTMRPAAAGGKSGSDMTKADEWSAVMARPSAESAVVPPPGVTVAPPPGAAVVAAAPRTSAAIVPKPRRQRQANSAWVLTMMVLLLCAAAAGWAVAHGTAATAWLIGLLVVAFGGVPIGLVALRLFGYDDQD